MKKPFFPWTDPTRSSGALRLGLWFFVHLGMAAALGFSILISGSAGNVTARINTDLFDMLPPSHSLRAAAEAEKALSGRSSRGVYILAGHEDFNTAREAAGRLYEELSGAANERFFEALSLYVDEGVTGEFIRYFSDYRYVLLDKETRELLENGGAGELAEDALAAAYGAFSFMNFDTLEEDPFLLGGREIERFLNSSLLSGGAMSLREDVLAARYGGLWYVMIRGALSSAGVSVTNSDSAVEKIYAAAGGFQIPGLKFVFSGVPFHSYESSSGAQREISLISSLALIIIIILFLVIFRSFLPMAASLGAIILSLLTAAGAVLLVFKEIHIFTFVFGTTLIGIGVDYSIHFFIHWKGNPSLPTGDAVRAHIFRGVTMSFISSEICFAALFLAPFDILKQFAVFLSAGLFSAWLTTLILYPRLKMPPPEQRRIPGRLPRLRGGKLLKRCILAALTGLSILLIIRNNDTVRIENNIAGLYTMSPALMEAEKTAAQVLDHGSAGWYFIVCGDSAGELLEREEALCARLELEIERGTLRSYMASSLFIPALETQRQSYGAAKKLLPLAEAQLAALGFPPESAELFRQDFERAADTFVLPGGDLPPALEDILSNLWIGEIAGRWYSCVLPLHAGEEGIFRSLAEGSDSVFFINKVKDIGTDLDSLTRIMFALLAAAYAVVCIIIAFLYSPKQALRICAVPCFLVLVTLAVLA
ncbi:MAG: MMPL family transporter, partial [Spirochaetaceae bacterium]|nr:MMPL family transporter [Spirochaetaceae bacterium]